MAIDDSGRIARRYSLIKDEIGGAGVHVPDCAFAFPVAIMRRGEEYKETLIRHTALALAAGLYSCGDYGVYACLASSPWATGLDNVTHRAMSWVGVSDCVDLVTLVEAGMQVNTLCREDNQLAFYKAVDNFSGLKERLCDEMSGGLTYPQLEMVVTRVSAVWVADKALRGELYRPWLDSVHEMNIRIAAGVGLSM